MKKIIFIGVVGLGSLLYGYEPSVYGAGDIDSAEPYGLTATEKNVLANRRQVQLLSNRVAEQQNRIDGLTTIIEGLNKQVLDLKEQLIASQQPNEDYNKTYSLLLNLGEMIDQINNNYVTQEDLRMAITRGGNVGNYSPQYTNTPISNVTPSLNMSDIYREGVQLFSRKSYNAAQEKFEKTLKSNYKSASSSYYLAEIAYYTNNYEDAIAYYKKSASLYDQASYMKILYLHTAIALSRTGQQEQAKGFFQYVIDHYPGTKAASIAKKNL